MCSGGWLGQASARAAVSRPLWADPSDTRRGLGSPSGFADFDCDFVGVLARCANRKSLVALPLNLVFDICQYVLAYSKPGVVCLWSPPGSGALWEGNRTFILKKLQVSTGSSALQPPCGASPLSPLIRGFDV